MSIHTDISFLHKHMNSWLIRDKFTPQNLMELKKRVKDTVVIVVVHVYSTTVYLVL